MTDQKTKGEEWLPIGLFKTLVRYEHSDGWMDFKAYRVVSTNLDGSNPQFERKGGRGGMDQTPNPDDAECIEGYVKWDGCMEASLEQTHFCGAEDVREYGQLLSALHALCLKLPSVDRDCAGYEETPSGGASHE